MTGATKSGMLAANANSYRGLLDGAKPIAALFESVVSRFKGSIDKPGGTYWEGATAEAGQSNAASGWKVTARVQDVIDKYEKSAAPIIDHTLVPSLTNGQNIIHSAEQHPEIRVNEDLTMTYTAPAGMSEEQADKNAKIVADTAKELKASGDKWWDATQQVKQLVDAAKQEIAHELNSAAGTFDVNKAVKDAALIQGSLTQVLGIVRAPKVLTPQDNQEIAFRNVFGHAPTTPADWNTAAMLDTHNYDPKYKGTDSDVRVAKIEPHPGKGQVQINAFIPGDKVWNFGKDLGDNRGFDKKASPEHSRVTMLIDYDNGVVVHRQNPSVTDTGKAAAGVPNVYVNELKDGTINLRYNSADGFMPGGLPVAEITAHEVRGNIVVQPGESGFKVGGTISGFPATEIYHGQDTLAQYMPSMGYNQWGPTVQLPSTAFIGDQTLLAPFQTDAVTGHGQVVPPPSPGTKLGPLTSIPTVPVK